LHIPQQREASNVSDIEHIIFDELNMLLKSEEVVANLNVLLYLLNLTIEQPATRNCNDCY